VIADAARPPEEKQRARRLRNEADTQLQLLTEAKNLVQSDFYSYRYFASEGFLPGYNFPRLPLSAFIPGRRERDEFISRPRFLAITEFGPRSIVYHEGSRYIINRVLMPPREGSGTITTAARETYGWRGIIARASIGHCDGVNILIQDSSAGSASARRAETN